MFNFASKIFWLFRMISNDPPPIYDIAKILGDMLDSFHANIGRLFLFKPIHKNLFEMVPRSKERRLAWGSGILTYCISLVARATCCTGTQPDSSYQVSLFLLEDISNKCS